MADKIAQAIIGKLKSKGFSQSEIADRVGCSKSTLSRVYSGSYCNDFIFKRLQGLVCGEILLQFTTTDLKAELMKRGQNIFS
jgi:hypothetical protein